MVLLAALTLGCFAPPAMAKQGKQRPLYWGAWIGSQLTGTEAPWDMNAVSTLASQLGKGLSLVEFSSPLADCHTSPCTTYRFPTDAMQEIRDYGAIPFFSWSTSSSSYDPSTLEDPEYQLADIASGRQDEAITRFATEAAAWGHPFFLRLNWEMNGNWFPWAEGVNGNAGGEYVAAWRHIHDIFSAVGATNVTWVWCPYVNIAHKFLPLSGLYPGDAYVNWTCLDGFNWARNAANPQKWRSFNQIFATTYRQVTKRIAPRKPMLLAEMASGGPPRAKATWIRNMFKQLPQRYQRIRGLIWFDKIDRGVPWPLDPWSPPSRAFARGIRSRAFMSNQYANLGLPGVIPPK